MNAVEILKMLPIFPDIFFTFRDSVQFEYEKSNGAYLEFEVFEDKIGVFSISSDEREKELRIMLGDKKEGASRTENSDLIYAGDTIRIN